MYKIIKGSRTDINPPFIVRLTDESTKDPFNFTPVTAITACFKNADDTELVVSLVAGIVVSGSPFIGKLRFELTAAQTALLAAVEEPVTLELTITITGDPFKVKIPNAYTVEESEC